VFTASLPDKGRPIVPCVCLARTAEKTRFPLYCCHVLKGDVYRPSGRNDDSSTVACIRFRKNIYEHSFIVALPSNGLFTKNLSSPLPGNALTCHNIFY
jgi:hypothetical protein